MIYTVKTSSKWLSHQAIICLMRTSIYSPLLLATYQKLNCFCRIIKCIIFYERVEIEFCNNLFVY